MAITYSYEGLKFRAITKSYKQDKARLEWLPSVNTECKMYINNPDSSFNSCRYHGTRRGKTVAIIGDSHAFAAHHGITNEFAKVGINTLLLSNTGCPPFLGAEYGMTMEEKDNCKKRIKEIIDIVSSADKDINDVFIFSRGPIYIKGKGLSEKEKNEPQLILPEVFKESLQQTVTLLKSLGKNVYYVAQVPEVGRNPLGCIKRPFKMIERKCGLNFADISNYQSDYLKIIDSIQGAQIIHTLPAFCSSGTCRVVNDEGALLYSDNNHLSFAGSDFLVNSVLKKYLDQIKG